MASSILQRIYYAAESPGSFGGAQRLYREAKKVLPQLTIQQVQKWLSEQNTYGYYKPTRHHPPTRRMEISRPLEQFQVDLAEIHQLAKYNDGVKYLLVVIDAFSRMAWVRPIVNKSAKSVASAFESILEGSGIPKFVMSDRGSEFISSQFRSLLKKHNIKQFYMGNSRWKAPFAERFIRTLRGRLARFMEYRDTNRYVDKLESIVASYCRSYHRSIKMRPVDVNESNVAQVWSNIYGNCRKGEDVQKFQFQIGDAVRLAKEKGTFGRGYVKQWTDEIFTVCERNYDRVPYYKIKDQSGAIIEGSFYNQELQKISG